MVIEDAGIKGITKTFGEVEKVMFQAGFVRAGAWDYDKASFDMKFSNEESDFYLRIPAYAVSGRLENPKAEVELDHPIFMRHLFPHGLDRNAEIPEDFRERIDQAITEVREGLS
ncbi:YugN family protein [Paludifilum halophilum]|nr:YugN family protein [Paludifilum halophilum]